MALVAPLDVMGRLDTLASHDIFLGIQVYHTGSSGHGRARKSTPLLGLHGIHGGSTGD